MSAPLALACLFLAAAPAPAPASRAEARYAAGKAAFAGGEFAKALRELDAAAADASDDATLARVQLLRGQCFAAQRDSQKAEDAFGRALAADPEASLDPSVVRPSVVLLLEKVRGALRSELVVRSDAADARASLDGRPLGPLPVKAAVPIGRHKVEVAASDGRTESQEVVLRPSKSHEVWIKFPAAAPVAASPAAVPAAPAGEPEPPAQVAAPAEPRSAVRPFADLRGVVEATTGNLQGEVGLGLDLFGHALLSAHFTAGHSLGVTGRLTGSLPSLVSIVGAYACAEVPVLFVPEGTAVGVGGALGLELAATSWLEPFVEVSGRRFLTLPDGYRASYLMASAGVRLRLP